jgi:3-phenylpropionate/trans-cinnamate dioxygenase ferredoxin subunit
MGEWIRVADLDDIGEGGLYVWVGNEEVLLVRHGEEVRAIGYLCSHQEMELEGGHLEGDSWVCPHHGARFDLRTGEALTMPAIEPVPVFEVKVEEGKVLVKEPES